MEYYRFRIIPDTTTVNRVPPSRAQLLDVPNSIKVNTQVKYRHWPNFADGAERPMAPKDKWKIGRWRWCAPPWAGKYPQIGGKSDKGNWRRATCPFLTWASGTYGATWSEAPERATRRSDEKEGEAYWLAGGEEVLDRRLVSIAQPLPSLTCMQNNICRLQNILILD